MGTEDNKQYENRYAILCENPCDAFGMLNTLDKIIEPANVVVLDTSLIPTVRKDIERLTIDQARKLWLVYGALNRIFTDNKARIYPAVYSEIESHLGSERAAADSLGRDSDFLRYAQAIDQLSICLSKPA